MTLTNRVRAAVVTADLTYKGHVFCEHTFADGTKTVTVHAPGVDEPLLTLTDATVTETARNTVWRVVGTNAAGETVVWRVVRQCARCASPSVTATPSYDRP